MTHLTDATYRRLLEGSLPPDEGARLARHLDEDCAECEAFLASREAVDWLDGQVDRAFAALAPAGASGGNDLELARIERRLREMEHPPRRSPRFVPVALAAAAAILVAGVAGLLVPRSDPRRPTWTGEKGAGAHSVPVRLRFLVLTAGVGGVEIAKGVSGQTVSASSSLEFEIETGRAADVAIGRVPQYGKPDFFWHERVGAGRAQATVRGHPAAYPLLDALGAQRFVAVASEDPLDDARLARVASALATPAGMAPNVPGLDGVSFDAVEVEVR